MINKLTNQWDNDHYEIPSIEKVIAKLNEVIQEINNIKNLIEPTSH
jgi:hypothetical protein